MSWYSHSTMTRRLNQPGYRLLSFLKFSFAMVCLASLSFMVYEAYHIPKYQKFFPKIADRTMIDLKTLYYDTFGSDLVVFTKKIQAKKLLAKNHKIVKYQTGLTSRLQTKMFQLNQDKDAFVKVESFHKPAHAVYMLNAHGGDSVDQIEVGAPSFFKSHGLEEDGSYELTVMMAYKQNLVSITVYDSLTPKELSIAQGPQYESLMAELAEVHLPIATGIAKKQIVRLTAMK